MAGEKPHVGSQFFGESRTRRLSTIIMGAAGREFHDPKVRFRGNPTYQIGPVLPAMGYRPQQVKELEDTIHATPCDLVVAATPIDLGKILRINKPCERVRYELQEIGQSTLADLLSERFA